MELLINTFIFFGVGIIFIMAVKNSKGRRRWWDDAA
jgi:hypothetical protein